MYLRSAKTDLEDAGESVDGMVESTPKLQALLKSIAGVDILQADGTTFKSTYQILKELSQVWGSLTDVNKASVLEAIGGKRNANVTSALLENFSEAEKVLTTSQNSAGSALRENEKVLDSIQGKISVMKASFEDLSRNLLDGDLIKSLINIGTVIINVSNGTIKFVDSLGGLKTVLIAISGIIATIKVDSIFDFLGRVGSKIVNIKPSMVSFVGKLKELPLALKIAKSEGKGLSAALDLVGISASTAQIAIAALTAVVTIAIAVYSRWKQAQDEKRQAAKDAAAEASKLSTEIADLTSQYFELTEAVKTDSGAKENLLTVQDNLIEKLGLEKSEIRDLTATYGDYTEAIKHASVEKLKESERDLRGGLPEYEDELVDAANVNYWAGKKGPNVRYDPFYLNEEDAKELYKGVTALRNAGYEVVTGQVFWQDEDTASSAAIHVGPSDGIKTADEALDAYRQLGEMLDIVEDTIGSDNGLYKQIYAVYNNLTDPVNNYTSAIDNLNTNLAQQYMLTELQGQQIPKTEEEFETYRARVVKAAKASGEFVGTSTEIEDAVDNVLQQQGQFSAFYQNVASDANKTNESIKQTTNLVKELSTSLKAAAENKDVIANILKELNDSGSISPQSIVELFDKFSSVDGIDDYITQLVAAENDVAKQKEILNSLYGAYIEQSDILDNVTEKTAAYTEAQLKASGVTNAHEFVRSKLDKQIIEESGLLKNVTADNYENIKSQLEARGVLNSSTVAVVGLGSCLMNAAIKQGNLNNATIEGIKNQMLEKGASETLANQFVALAKTFSETQNSMLKTSSEATVKRIKTYGIELESIKTLADAEAAINKSMAPRTEDKYGRPETTGSISSQIISDAEWLKEYAKAQEAINNLATSAEVTLVTNVPLTSTSSEDSHKKEFDDWYTKLKWRRDNNIIDETNFLQQLDAKYKYYYENRAEYLEEYAKYSQEVYEGFKKLYQDDWNAQKEALEKQKNDLKELADTRKQALEDAKEEEDYKKDQAEKREEINKLKVLIASFRGTLSLSSQKKLRELQQQLKEKEEELNDFEKDKALERAKEQIDKEYENQEKAIKNQIEGIDKKLEDINKELPSIRSAIYDFARDYGVTITTPYASGTSSVPAVTQENGAEIIAGNISRGQFTMLTPTSKVWNASATQALWDFANSPQSYLSSVMDKISSFKQKAMSMIYSQPVNVNVGGITVNGNADKQAVQKIKTSQKEQVEEILKAMRKLQ